MTDKTLVFCNKCDYYKQEVCLDICGIPALCEHDPVKHLDPIKGVIYKYRTCKAKNEFCNCAHFKPLPSSFFGRLNKTIDKIF